jgi:predicted RNA-binding protein with PIN domain
VTEPLGQALPPDITAALVKGVGAYLRRSAQLDLPPKLRRFRSFADKALMRHTREILAVLDDEAQRALILEWLEEGKPALSKEAASLLEIAARRADGWEADLKGRARDESAPSGGKAGSDEAAERALERERAKTTKAKEELRRAKEEAAATLKDERARTATLTQQLSELESAIAGLTKKLDASEKRAAKAEERADREVRRARKDALDAEGQMNRLKEEARSLRKEAEELRTELARRAASPKPSTARKRKPSAPKGPRKPLPVPKGRYEDAPESLAEWLSAPNVHLVVDGYNVTKAPSGFGDLRLEVQRERLVDEVMKLARRSKVSATIVFDGSEVSPGTTRARRGSVKVEYSAEDEIADDHIVALLERLPAHPVIVATNDRELQDRSRALGATISTSDQLLALFR